ncbi:MAG: membrane protein insertion efficiency factor YidD [Candidatus Sungbacteria bacterium]|nr:membrane protein insertion efficiency factor YidD [Candidatus Sungbacteria bacterium]
MKNLRKQLKKYLVDFVCVAIYAYQRTISPDHGIFGDFFGSYRCKFSPSCSAYAASAIRQYGLLNGFMASSKRILRCNPWSSGGYDPP